MADNRAAGAPALDTNIESGGFNNEKAAHGAPATQGVSPTKEKAAVVDDDEDEDIDALIEDLESQDGHEMIDDDEEAVATGGVRTVPEDMLQTDSRLGLTEAEVVARRRKYGLNQMKEEKENLILKFFGFFVGPIQYVMMVSCAQLAMFCFFYPARFGLSRLSVTRCAEHPGTGRGGACGQTELHTWLCFAHFPYTNSSLSWCVGPARRPSVTMVVVHAPRRSTPYPCWSRLFPSSCCAFSARRLQAPHEVVSGHQLALGDRASRGPPKVEPLARLALVPPLSQNSCA
jgi:hypothetical protein